MGGVIIAIDPGGNTGWSRYDNLRLTACGICHPSDYPELPFVIGWQTEVPILVIENPQVYRQSLQKSDPNDLIPLANKVGALIGIFLAYYHLCGKVITPELPKPREWKGQIKKEMHHDREIPKLDPAEKTILQKALAFVPAGQRHDVKDAVCLGLWRAKR